MPRMPRIQRRANRVVLLTGLAMAVALVYASAPAPAWADTYPRQPGIDARHYAVRLTLLTTGSNEIDAEAAVTLRMVTPGTREALLDLTSATPDGKGMIVTSVTSAGRDIPIEHRANCLRRISGSATP